MRERGKEERKQDGKKKRRVLDCIWEHFRCTVASRWYHFGIMTVALGNFVVTFDVENDVDVHKWWLGGLENQKC